MTKPWLYLLFVQVLGASGAYVGHLLSGVYYQTTWSLGGWLVGLLVGCAICLTYESSKSKEKH